MENLKSVIDGYKMGMNTSNEVVCAYISALSQFCAADSVKTIVNQELDPLARFICDLMDQQGLGWEIGDFYARRDCYVHDAEVSEMWN